MTLSNFARWIKWGILILLGCILLAFALSNREYVTVSFFPFPYEISLPFFVMLLATLGAGVVLGWTVSSRQNVHLKQQLKKQDLQVKAKEKEMSAMKADEVLRQNLLQLEKKG